MFDWKHGHKQACPPPCDRPTTIATHSAEADPKTAASLGAPLSEPAKTKKGGPLFDCAFCGTVDLPLKPCNRCGVPQYCSRECQLAHWKEGHKQACVPPDQR